MSKNIFSIIVKSISVLTLLGGVLLFIYIFLGPSLGLINRESASFGVLLAFPVLFVGVIITVLSFKGYIKSSLAILILLILVFVFNIWNQHQIELAHPGIRTTPGGLPISNQNNRPIPATPN